MKWPDVDSDIADWVHSIIDDLVDALEDDLIGVYLHGSLATGCYYRPKSDLDLVAVCRSTITTQRRGVTAR